MPADSDPSVVAAVEGVVEVIDPGGLVELFAERPDIHAYGLGDLDEPFWSASRWFRRGDAAVGMVPLPGSNVVAGYAISHRDPAGTIELFADLAPGFPAGMLVTGPTGLLARVARVRPVADLGPHDKMVLTHRAARSDAADLGAVDPLGPTDVDEVMALYDTEPGAVFALESMLADGTFVGVRTGGRLVAAAGTHLLSERHGVAVIGAVFTHPDHRGRGLGARVTAGAIARIGDRASTIGLNVASDNHAARRAYARLGFEVCLAYEEIELR